jgi:hypothetical protein
MQDIHRMFSDYLEYLDYIIDAMDNMYRNINAMPLVAYTKHAMNIIEGKVRICGFLVWFGLFVHPFSHICNIGHVNYRLQFTTQLIIYEHPHNTIQ